jgi:hypothetical protein
LALSSPLKRSAAESKVVTARGNAARPADPTAAYCVFRSSCAFADHGISSQSRHTHVVFNVVQRSAAVIAARTRSRNRPSRSPSLKNRLPVRVVTLPISPSSTPNRSLAARSSRQTVTTALEPMCFSSQTTRGAPWLRK